MAFIQKLSSGYKQIEVVTLDDDDDEEEKDEHLSTQTGQVQHITVFPKSSKEVIVLSDDSDHDTLENIPQDSDSISKDDCTYENLSDFGKDKCNKVLTSENRNSSSSTKGRIPLSGVTHLKVPENEGNVSSSKNNPTGSHPIIWSNISKAPLYIPLESDETRKSKFKFNLNAKTCPQVSLLKKNRTFVKKKRLKASSTTFQECHANAYEVTSTVPDSAPLENASDLQEPAQEVFDPSIFQFQNTDVSKEPVSSSVSGMDIKGSFLQAVNNVSSQDKNVVYFVLDTCVLMSNLHLLKRIVNLKTVFKLPTLYLPWIVIQELDYIKDKKDAAKKVKALEAVKFIYGGLTSLPARIVGEKATEAKESEQSFPQGGPHANDDYLLHCCLKLSEKGYEAVLLTDDINLQNKAIIHGIQTCNNCILSKNFFQLMQQYCGSPNDQLMKVRAARLSQAGLKKRKKRKRNATISLRSKKPKKPKTS